MFFLFSHSSLNSYVRGTVLIGFLCLKKEWNYDLHFTGEKQKGSVTCVRWHSSLAMDSGDWLILQVATAGEGHGWQKVTNMHRRSMQVALRWMVYHL